MNIKLPPASALSLYAPVTAREAALFAWKAAVAAGHRSPSAANSAECRRTFAAKEAAPRGAWKIIQGPPSPFAPFA